MGDDLPVVSEPMIRGLAANIEQDRFMFRTVVLCLGITLLGSFGAITILAGKGIAVPAEIVGLGSGCLGALAGLLANNK